LNFEKANLSAFSPSGSILKRSAVLLAALIGAGCGGDAVYGGTSGVRLEDLPRRIAEWNCRMLFECCTPAQVMTAGSSFFIGSFTDETGCRAAYESFLSQATPQLQDAIRQGRILYSEAAAGSCIAGIDAMTCAQLTAGAAPECNVWTPLQKDGDVCESDSECISGACEIGIDPQGTCAPPAKLGEPCSGNCEKGSVCDNSNFACSPPKKLGESCLTSSECESKQCSSTKSVCIPDSICPE
jgi:hypothetical protein